MSDTPQDYELFHYGVKGMKWGVSRDEAMLARIAGRKSSQETVEDKQRYKEYKKSTTRKERRADKREALRARAEHVVAEAADKPQNKLVETKNPRTGLPIIMTGEEFVREVSSGGSFSPMDTYVIDLKKR